MLFAGDCWSCYVLGGGQHLPLYSSMHAVICIVDDIFSISCFYSLDCRCILAFSAVSVFTL